MNLHGKLLDLALMPADATVEAFYIISGFYMAMLLNEKYHSKGVTYGDFILSRFFRLVPAYYLVVILTLIVLFVAWLGFGIALAPLSHLQNIDAKVLPTIILYLLVPQISIVGLDLTNFFTLTPLAGLSFTPTFLSEPMQLWRLLLVPQARSLALELYFYIMAPLILRRPIWVLVTLITLSFFVRVFLALDYDFRFDLWSYRFFPSELLYFLSGSLAYRLSKDELSTGAKKIILTLCFILTLLAGYKAHFGLGSTELFLSHIALGLLFVFIPKIFEISKNISFDRYMGELSYPLYISHMLVIWVTALIFVQGSMQQRVAIFLGTVLLSVGIFVLVEKRVDRWRHRVFANKT